MPTDQMNVPAFTSDHTKIKEMAAKRGISIKDLIHEMVENYQKLKRRVSELERKLAAIK